MLRERTNSGESTNNPAYSRVADESEDGGCFPLLMSIERGGSFSSGPCTAAIVRTFTDSVLM